MISAIIVAGGEGSRIGGKIPKQLLKLNGKEILSFSVSTFLNHPKVDEVIIACHPKWAEHVSRNYPDCKVVLGGNRRQDSSLMGVKAASSQTSYVLIHDAARPFISYSIISNCIEALIDSDGSAPVLNVSNSLIKLEGGKTSFVDRTTIREVQTPQCFKKETILAALSSKLEGTDEIGMVLRTFPDSNLTFVQGDRGNFKITTETDLQLASLKLTVDPI